MTKAWIWRKFGNTTLLSKRTEDIPKKSFTINSSIATQDSIHPDKEVHYTYIGMVSLDEGFPLHIYFNDDIELTTIVEPLDTFDLEKYKDRIINLDILTADISAVEEAGISNVMKITPATGLELHVHEASRTVDTGAIARSLSAYGGNVGKWAIYRNKLYIERGKKLHALWFEEIGLPSWGEEFDDVPRGWYEVDDTDLELVVYNEGYPKHVDTLFRNEDRLVERAKQLEGIDDFAEVQLYEVSGISKTRLANKSFSILSGISKKSFNVEGK